MAIARVVLVRRSWTDVRLEAIRQLHRAAEGDAVPALDLVRCDAQALVCEATEEVGREEG